MYDGIIFLKAAGKLIYSNYQHLGSFPTRAASLKMFDQTKRTSSSMT